MAEVGEWQRLAALLDDDKSVQDAVRKAVESGDDPWATLLDGLDEAGALAYLRADDTGMELADALMQLPRIFTVRPDLKKVNDVDDLVAATALADALLAEVDLRVVRLIEDDDTWPVVIVAADVAEAVQVMAESLGQQILPGRALRSEPDSRVHETRHQV